MQELQTRNTNAVAYTSRGLSDSQVSAPNGHMTRHDKQQKAQTNKQTNKQTNNQKNTQTNKQAHKQTSKQTSKYTNTTHTHTKNTYDNAVFSSCFFAELPVQVWKLRPNAQSDSWARQQATASPASRPAGPSSAYKHPDLPKVFNSGKFPRSCRDFDYDSEYIPK